MQTQTNPDTYLDDLLKQSAAMGAAERDVSVARSKALGAAKKLGEVQAVTPSADEYLDKLLSEPAARSTRNALSGGAAGANVGPVTPAPRSTPPRSTGVNITGGKPVGAVGGGGEFRIPRAGYSQPLPQRMAQNALSEQPFVPKPSADDAVSPELRRLRTKVLQPLREQSAATAAQATTEKEQADYLRSLPAEQRRAAAESFISRGEHLGDESRKIVDMRMDPRARLGETVLAPLKSSAGRIASGVGRLAEEVAPYIGYGEDYKSSLTNTGANLQESGRQSAERGYQGPVARFAQGATSTVAMLPAGLSAFVMDAYLESIGSGEDHATALKHAATTAAGVYAGGKLSRAFESQVEGAVKQYLARSGGLATGLTGASVLAGDEQTFEGLGHTAAMSLGFGAAKHPKPSSRAPADVSEAAGVVDAPKGQAPPELVPERVATLSQQSPRDVEAARSEAERTAALGPDAELLAQYAASSGRPVERRQTPRSSEPDRAEYTRATNAPREFRVGDDVPLSGGRTGKVIAVGKDSIKVSAEVSPAGEDGPKIQQVETVGKDEIGTQLVPEAPKVEASEALSKRSSDLPVGQPELFRAAPLGTGEVRLEFNGSPTIEQVRTIYPEFNEGLDGKHLTVTPTKSPLSGRSNFKITFWEGNRIVKAPVDAIDRLGLEQAKSLEPNLNVGPVIEMGEAKPEAVAKAGPVEQPWEVTQADFRIQRPAKTIRNPNVARDEPSHLQLDDQGDLFKGDPRKTSWKIGDEGIFYRASKPPASGHSYDARDNVALKGVSVYPLPDASSFAGLKDTDWYTGRGRIVGEGSDGEPLIKPSGKWQKFSDAKSRTRDDDAHRFWVEDALKNNQSIAAKVLADYPDLQAKAVKQGAAETPQGTEPLVKLEGVQPSEKPVRIKKGKPTKIDSETLDIVQYIRSRGGVNLGSLTGEARRMRESRLRQPGVITKRGLKWDDMETELRAEGYLQEGESLLDAMDDAARGKQRYANSSALDAQIDQENALYGVGLTGKVDPNDARIIFRQGIGNKEWSNLVYEVLNHESQPTEQTVRAFRRASDKLGISDRAISDILRAGEHGRSPEATEFAFGEESDAGTSARGEAPLTTTQIDRVREIEQHLHNTGEPIDDFLRQGGLLAQSELAPAEAGLLREMRANRNARRAPDKSEQPAMLETTPTVESKAEAQAREPKPNVNFGLFAGTEEASKAVPPKLVEGKPAVADFAKNKVFTQDKVAAARERMAARKGKKLGPEAGEAPILDELADAAIIAGAHVESGVREFAEFSKRMVEEFGDWIEPRLKGLYDDANRKFALSETPETAREHKLYTGDKIYHEIVTDQRAIDEGRAFLKENSVEAAIAHYKAKSSPDAPDNAIAFAAIEDLQNRERAIRTSDPKEADRLLDQHNDLVATMAAKMTIAARGVRSVRFAEEFGEAVAVRTAQKVKSEDRPWEKLTAEETRGITDTAREMREVNTALEAKLAEAETRANEAEATLASEREIKRIQREEGVAARRGRRAVTKEGLAAERSSLLAELARVTGRTANLNVGIPTDAVPIIAKLGRNLVKDGYVRTEALIDELYNQIKTVLADVTKRDVRDAFSGYGKIAEMSKDELSVKIRELKNLSRDISAIEDIESGQRPLRSGLQRDPMSTEVRESKRKVADKLKEHGIRIERGPKDPVAQQKSALDGVKTRLKNDITDKRKRIEQLLAGEKPPPNTRARVQYDRQANQLKAERDALNKQLEAIEGPRKMSDEQRANVALRNVEREIKRMEADVATGTYTGRQKGQPVSTPELEAQRERLKSLRAERETLKPPKTDAQYNTEARKRVDQGIKELERLLGGGAPRQRHTPVYDRATLDLQHRQIQLRREYNRKLDRLKPHYRARQAGRGILNVFNLTRAVKASSDFFGGVVRQGRVLSADNLREAGQIAFKDQFTTLSKIGFEEAYEAMRRDPNLTLLQNAGVEFTGEPLRRSSALSAKSEGFQYDWADTIPGVSHSQRSFDASLDLLRLKAGGNWVAELQKNGLTPENNPKAYHDLGRLINYASGRGSFGKGLNELFAKTNPIWFAPRFRASRVQLIHTAFNPLADVHPRVRAIAMRSLAKYYGGVASVLALGALTGAWKVSLDHDDADFFKAKVGDDTHYDFSGGESNDFRLAARLTGAMIDKAQGLEARPGKGVVDIAEQYVGSTLSPAAGYAKGVIRGKDFKGDKFEPIEEAFKLAVPMGVEGVYEGWQTAGGPGAREVVKEGFGGFRGERVKKGLAGAAKGVPGLASINVSSYKEAPEDLQATRQLATRWKQKQRIPFGDAPDEPSPYRPLKRALETNDPYEARLALKELRADTQKQLERQGKQNAATEADKKIFEAVKDWSARPFTGSKEHEQAFEKSLTLEQAGRYAEAKRLMNASFERFLELWSAQGGQSPSRTTKSPVTIPNPAAEIKREMRRMREAKP